MRLVQVHLSSEFEWIDVYPLSDVHAGDPLHLQAEFEAFIDFIQREPNRFLVLNGDLVDNATVASVGNTYAATMSPQEQKRYIIKALRPVSDRVLFICTGNHETGRTRNADGQDITGDIAMALDLEERYCPNGGFLQVTFGKARNGKRRSYTGYIMHGSSGGKKSGSALNAIEDIAGWAIADFLVMGHSHRKIASANAGRLEPDLQNKNIRKIVPLTVVSSSWLDFGGYAQAKGYRPTSEGSVMIRLWAYDRAIEGVVRV